MPERPVINIAGLEWSLRGTHLDSEHVEIYVVMDTKPELGVEALDVLFIIKEVVAAGKPLYVTTDMELVGTFPPPSKFYGSAVALIRPLGVTELSEELLPDAVSPSQEQDDPGDED